MKHPTIRETMLAMMAFHYGQVDKSGAPYFAHPLRVMLRIGSAASQEYQHAALLHDVIEGCGVTPADLRNLGYSEAVIDMVVLLSRPEEVQYRAYIRRLVASGNTGAQMIKLADLMDNCSALRLEQLTPEVRVEVEAMITTRYKPAIGQLRMALGELVESMVSEELEVELDMEG